MPDARPMRAADQSGASAEFRRGWRVVLAGAFAIGISMPTIGTYGLTFFIESWNKAFGWPKEDIGIAASCLTITILLTAPLVGRLCDTFGVRWVASISILLFALSQLALSQLEGAIWQLYAGYIAMAALGAGASHVCYLRSVASWFDEARGLALGAAGAGAGLAAALAPYLLMPLIADYGWRAGWQALAVVSCLAVPVVLLCLGERMEQPAAAGSSSGLSAAEARKTGTFWLLLLGTAALGAALVGVSVQLVPLVTSYAGSTAAAAQAATAFGISIMAGRLVTGFLLDRFLPHLIAATVAALPAVGICIFVVAPAPGSLALAVGLGLAGGAEHDIIGYIVARAFGLKAFSEIFGWIFGALALGASIGPLVIRLLKYLDYGLLAPLASTSLLCLVASVLFSRLGRERLVGATRPA